MESVMLGIDRYLSIEWADFALALFSDSRLSKPEKRDALRAYLNRVINGKDSARKTYNQLNRLWLLDDQNNELRSEIISRDLLNYENNKWVFHYGLALNSFPLFLEVSRILGSLAKLQQVIAKEQVHSRTIEVFGRPSTIPRTTDRVLQTMQSWGLIKTEGKTINIETRSISSEKIAAWLLECLIATTDNQQVFLHAINVHPQLLGITIPPARELIINTTRLTIIKDTNLSEVAIYGNRNRTF